MSSWLPLGMAGCAGGATPPRRTEASTARSAIQESVAGAARGAEGGPDASKVVPIVRVPAISGVVGGPRRRPRQKRQCNESRHCAPTSINCSAGTTSAKCCDDRYITRPGGPGHNPGESLIAFREVGDFDLARLAQRQEVGMVRPSEPTRLLVR